MYKLYLLVFSFALLVSCSSSKKDYLSRMDDDKTVFDAVKALEKDPSDSLAAKALPVLYDHAKEKRLDRIIKYNAQNDLGRWDKLIGEYGYLQKMYEAITAVRAAARLVDPENYQRPLTELKERAAEEYYNAADDLFSRPGRQNAKMAYEYFLKADKWIPGYRDAKMRSQDAYRNSMVIVVINEVRDNTYFFTGGRGSYNIDYINARFRQNLVRSLNNQTSGRYPAKYYIREEADRNNIIPGLMVDLSLRNIDMPRPVRNITTQRSAKEIEIGRDTSGRPVYQTVYANINIERMTNTTRLEMELSITDMETGKRIVYAPYREEYSWQQENWTYSGDSRALSDYDWRMINSNTPFTEPLKDEVLSQIYDRIFPQVRSRISSSVDR